MPFFSFLEKRLEKQLNDAYTEGYDEGYRQGYREAWVKGFEEGRANAPAVTETTDTFAASEQKLFQSVFADISRYMPRVGYWQSMPQEGAIRVDGGERENG